MNAIGTVSGAAAAILVRRFAVPEDGGKSNIELVPVTLIGVWLTYRLIP